MITLSSLAFVMVIIFQSNGAFAPERIKLRESSATKTLAGGSLEIAGRAADELSAAQHIDSRDLRAALK